MARAIDGTWDSFLLNLSYLTLKDFQENKAGLNTLKTAVESQPTITPPNEPLRCTGCMYLDEDFVPCVHCVRAAGYADYYRRPPEGEVDGE